MFRVTKLADYGVLLMSALTGAERKHLLTQADGPMPTVSATELSHQTGVPAPTVGKLLRQLVREGLLTSVRGVQGGYRLARPSTAISVAELIEAIEGPIALTECLATETPSCDISSLCPTKANWGRINHAIRGALHDVSLDEMATSEALHEVAPLEATAPDALPEAAAPGIPPLAQEPPTS